MPDGDNVPLLQQRLPRNYSAQVWRPTNIEALRSAAGQASVIVPAVFWPLVPLALPFLAVAIGTTVAAHARAEGFQPAVERLIYDFDYEAMEKHYARADLDLQVSVWRRTSGIVDIIFQPKVTFTIDHFSDAEVIKALYQDTLSFYIGLKASSVTTREHQPFENSVGIPANWVLNTRGIAPENEIDKIEYSVSHRWSTSAGISLSEKPSADVRRDDEFLTQSSQAIPEFGLWGRVNGDSQGYGWTAAMRIAYRNGFSTADPYDVRDPAGGLTIDNGSVKWLKDPPRPATSSLPLSFLTSFMSTNVPNDREVCFTFNISQRVIWAEVAGRWGASGARLGGEPVLVPGFFQVSGTICVNLASNSVTILDETEAFVTLLDVAKAGAPTPGA
jgi:hypothetical protein